MVQRTRHNHNAAQSQPAPAAQPSAPVPTPAAPVAPAAAAPPAGAETERRYSINFRPPSGQAISVQNITADETRRLLNHIAAVIENFISAGREGHLYLLHVQSDAWFTSTVTDFIGGHVAPPISVWDSPVNSMARARDNMKNGNIRDALQAMHEATRMANNASSRLAQYREDTAQGVAQVVVYLEYTETAGAIAATIATGGLAEGVLATAAVAATTAGVYAAAQNAAGQGSEMHSGLRQNFDVGDMLRHSAREAIAGFVGALTGGALKAGFGRTIGRFMQSRGFLLSISNAIGSNGPRLAEFIASNLARLSSEFISFIGSTAISTAVSNVVTRMIGNARDLAALRQVEAEGFLRQVWQALVQGGITAVLIAFLSHTMPTRRAGRAPQVQTPELPPPSGPRALLEPPRPIAQAGESNQSPVDPLAATQPALGAAPETGAVAQANQPAPVAAVADIQPAMNDPATAQTLVDPLAETHPGPLSPAQARPVARPFQLPAMSELSYEQAQGALRYARMGVQRALAPGNYSPGGVLPTSDWAVYAADYQNLAGHGTTPPRYGWVSPDGRIHVFSPGGNLPGPNEALPPLPPSLRSNDAPSGPAPSDAAALGSGSPQAPVDQPAEPTSAGQVNEGEPGIQGESSRSAQTPSGSGGQSYIALSRQQAEAITEFIDQFLVNQHWSHEAEILGDRVRRSVEGPRRDAFVRLLSQATTQSDRSFNRLMALREQIGDPALLARVNSRSGINHHFDPQTYQQDFLLQTRNAGPAPEGGFISSNGILVTLER